MAPGVISTDYDQALRNTILTVFPDTLSLLCLWHANKNIQQYCKHKFTTTEAYSNFFQLWLRIVESPDIPEYISRLHKFSAAYSGTLEGTTLETQECV